MKKKRILCFGDSLTWGFDPDTRGRFPDEDRWTQVLQKELGEEYQIIEEGQNGRTIATDDPAEGEKNGLLFICEAECARLRWTRWKKKRYRLCTGQDIPGGRSCL